MKKLTLLSTAAAITMIGAGVAMAQGLAPANKTERAAPAPTAQQNAPAEKVAPTMKHNRIAPETTGQSVPERLEPGHGGNVHSNSTKPNRNKSHEATAQAPSEAMKSKADKRIEKSEMKGEGDKSVGGTQERSERNNRLKHSERNPRNGRVENSERMNNESKEGHRATTGQGAAAVAGKLSHEQRSKIVTIFREHHHARPTHLNISIHVGARVPQHVHLYPLPVEVVEVYPEWRGYDYILVGDEILVIDPDSHEIIAVLET